MQLNFRRQGQGQAVIVIHGLFGSLDNLGNLSKALAQQYEVIAIDVRNHGLSPRCNTMSYHDMAGDVLALINQLNLEQPFIVGHSMGGKIAMMTAALAPEQIQGLVIADMAPVAYPSARHTAVFNGLQAVIDAQSQTRREAEEVLRQHVTMPGVRQFLLKSFIPKDPQIWRFNVPALQENYPNILGWPTLTTPYLGPTLFIKGGDSDYIQAAHQAQVVQQFPNASAKVINGTGHWLHAEKPQLFNRLVADFLTKVS